MPIAELPQHAPSPPPSPSHGDEVSAPAPSAPAPAGAFDLNHETAKMLAASNRGARIDRAIGELRYAAPATAP